MTGLTLRLLDGRSVREWPDLVSIVAEDASGQFGLMPGHEPLLTVLEPGLLRCRAGDGRWRYLASTGGVLCCREDRVELIAARFLADDDAERLGDALQAQLMSERENRRESRSHQVELDRTLMKRLREWAEAAAR